MTDLISEIKESHFALTQRALSFEIDGISVRAVPDLVLMFRDRPPSVIDWKVKAQSIQDFRNQLSIYALAISRVAPHRDFPLSVMRGAPENVKLIEVQLLANLTRIHKLAIEDIADLENLIALSSHEMLLALGDGEPSSPEDFETTIYPDLCTRCNFRKLCWENG